MRNSANFLKKYRTWLGIGLSCIVLLITQPQSKTAPGVDRSPTSSVPCQCSAGFSPTPDHTQCAQVVNQNLGNKIGGIPLLPGDRESDYFLSGVVVDLKQTPLSTTLDGYSIYFDHQSDGTHPTATTGHLLPFAETISASTPSYEFWRSRFGPNGSGTSTFTVKNKAGKTANIAKNFCIDTAAQNYLIHIGSDSTWSLYIDGSRYAYCDDGYCSDNALFVNQYFPAGKHNFEVNMTYLNNTAGLWFEVLDNPVSDLMTVTQESQLNKVFSTFTLLQDSSLGTFDYDNANPPCPADSYYNSCILGCVSQKTFQACVVSGPTPTPSPLPPSKLVFTTPPPANANQIQYFSFAVAIESADNKIVTSDQSAIAVSTYSDSACTIPIDVGLHYFGGNANAGSLVVPDLAVINTSKFYIKVTDGSLTPACSNQITINPTIITQPLSQTVIVGSTVNLSVGTVPGTFNYEWSLNGSPLNNAAQQSYSFTAPTTPGTYDYTVVVCNPGNCALAITSQTAVITVSPPPPSQLVLTTPPPANTNAIQYFGFTAAVESADGNIVASDQSTVTMSTYADAACTIPVDVGLNNYGVNANAGSAVFSNLAVVNTGKFYLKVTDGSLNPACSPQITVNPTIITEPFSQTVYAGSTVPLSVSTVPGTFNFQWSRNGSAIAGAFHQSESFTAPSTPGVYPYTVVVSNPGNNALAITSQTAFITVRAVTTPTPTPKPTPLMTPTPSKTVVDSNFKIYVSVKVFPNPVPTNGTLNVYIDGFDTPSAVIEMYDMNGRLATQWTQQITAKSSHMGHALPSNLIPGMYGLQVRFPTYIQVFAVQPYTSVFKIIVQ